MVTVYEPNFKIGQLAGQAYINGKNCINFPKSVVETAASAYKVAKDNGADECNFKLYILF